MSSIKSAPVQKYCKVCHDAGKTEAEYRSHFIRENKQPNSKVVCPTLLALECRFCFKSGHTVKYCTVLKERDSKPVTNRPNPSQKKVEKGKPISTNPNVFASLYSDSEDEEEKAVVKTTHSKKVVVKEEFPALPSMSSSIPKSVVTTNYVAALAKPAPVKRQPIAPPPPQETKSAPWAEPWAAQVAKASTLNWAAMESSDDDDDYNEEPEVSPYYHNETINGYDSDW
jgi:hypothetical protein